MTADAQVSVAVNVTSFASGPYGGGIVQGSDDEGNVWSVIVRRGRAARDPLPGERWRFAGVVHATVEHGTQLEASTAFPLLPTGDGVVRYLASNPRIAGVGKAYARRLWAYYGERLYTILQARDVRALSIVVGPLLATNIVLGWGLYTDEVETFRWLDQCGVAARTAAQAIAIWGTGARQRLEADPYALCLLESWQSVDSAALRAGVTPDDDRRLLAAVEEASARRFMKKHTSATLEELRHELRALIGPDEHTLARAIALALSMRRLLPAVDGAFQARGPYEMERFVERALSERLARSGGATSESIGLLGAIERAGAGLNERQRQAVQMALSSSVSVLCGSAGTGKTTTLRAILAAARAGFGADYTVYQVALAGRAAKRMAEATGAEAVTVYRFLRDERLRQRRAELGLLIVDEASMLDLPAVYSLLRAIPASTNLLFVGDPSQLPPIGPGLVFHRMVASRRIPRVELTAIHRHAANSGIPLVGAAIRGGRFPRLPTYDLNEPEQPGVFIHRAESDHVATATVRVLEALAGAPLATGVRQRDIQILCATRRGPAGAVALNEMIERKHIAGGARNARWGLAIGSKILWAVNDHHRGSRAAPRSLLNGTLGIVAEVNDEGLVVHFDDGTSDVLRREDLTKVERGWAVSVHKAQGSAFGHVLMPVTPSRLLDRNLVYTAVTRAVRSVVLIGDELLLRAAVKEVTHTMTRRVGLNLGGDSASSGMASTTI